MPTDERVEVGLGAWTPPDMYDQPQLEPEGPIQREGAESRGDITSDQPSADAAARFTLHGKGYVNDISVFQKYEGKTLSLRHDVYTGDVYIKSVHASSTDMWDDVDDFRFVEGQMQDVTDRKRVYTYRVDLIKAELIEDT